MASKVLRAASCVNIKTPFWEERTTFEHLVRGEKAVGGWRFGRPWQRGREPFFSGARLCPRSGISRSSFAMQDVPEKFNAARHTDVAAAGLCDTAALRGRARGVSRGRRTMLLLVPRPSDGTPLLYFA